MTREEAIKAFNDNAIQEYAGSSQYYLKKEDYYEIIDKIYYDFESRICKNCNYYKDGYCTNYEDEYCINMKSTLKNCDSIVIVDENFGCNKFERREDV